jgi:hypothetical protein
MATNITTFALFVPAMKLIAASDVGDLSKALAAAVVFATTLAVVLVPLAAAAVAPGLSGRALDRLGAWMQAHKRAVQVALGFGFGSWLLIKGVLAM